MRRFKSRSTAVRLFMSPHMFGAKASSVFFILLAAGIFLVSIMNPSASQKIQMKTSDLLLPVFNVVNAPIEKAADFISAVSGIGAMQAENARLMEENEKLREWYQKALLLGNENKELQSLLNLKAEGKRAYISSRVMLDSSNAYVKSLMVTAGQDDGVQKGDAVLSGEGVVGRVIDIGYKTSRILLLTDMNSRLPVYIEGVGQKAIMAGDNTSAPYILHLDQKAVIEDGMRVITSGHGGLFPYGLPVGEIKLSKDGTSRVSLFTDIQNIRYVRMMQEK